MFVLQNVTLNYNKTMPDTFADRFRDLRKNKDFTQEKIAEVLEVSLGTVQSYEQGKRTPSDKTLQKIAQLFGETLVYLKYGYKVSQNAEGYFIQLPDILNEADRERVEDYINLLTIRRQNETEETETKLISIPPPTEPPAGIIGLQKKQRGKPKPKRDTKDDKTS